MENRWSDCILPTKAPTSQTLMYLERLGGYGEFCRDLKPGLRGNCHSEKAVGREVADKVGAFTEKSLLMASCPKFSSI